MIIDLDEFIRTERPIWDELEAVLAKIETDAAYRMDLGRVRRFHYLYQRASGDLAKIVTFASEPRTRAYLESLVARTYGEIHASRDRSNRFRPIHWLFQTFPQTFRLHIGAFYLSVALTLGGVLFGGVATMLDPDAKAILLPFEHLQGSPSERVRKEEARTDDELKGAKAPFSSMLMTHNTRVAVLAMALGMTFGIGTMMLLFSNGVILGAVVFDYVMGGEGVFVTGWLLPHGSIEIPAILIAGQAGLLLAGSLIGWGRRASLRERLREIRTDLVTLILGVALLLVWAGIIEAFLSQYHEPIIPYTVKIVFGAVQLGLLISFLSFAGRGSAKAKHEERTR